MAFEFEDLMDRVTELAQTGVAKTMELTSTGIAKSKEVAEIIKLKMDSTAEQSAIRKAYIELGKLYYAERGAAPEAPYTALCERITAAKAKIAYNDERIADIKAASNLTEEDIEASVDTQVPPEEDTGVCGGESCSCCDEPASACDAPEADKREDL